MNYRFGRREAPAAHRCGAYSSDSEAQPPPAHVACGASPGEYGGMKLSGTLVAVVACVTLLGGPAAQAATPRFQGKAVGNSASGRVAKKSFPIGAGYGLYFRDNRRSSTRYRLCAMFNGSTQRCATGRTGSRGKDSIKSSPLIFNPQRTGRLEWRWTVGGRFAASWTVTVTEGD